MNALRKVTKAIREGGVSLVFIRLAKKIWWSMNRLDYKHNILHAYKELPEVDVQERPIRYDAGDEDIARRILDAFNFARSDDTHERAGDIWDIIEEKHGDFYAVMHDPRKVAEYLNNMNQHNIVMGISSSTIGEFREMRQYPKVRQEWGAFVKDTLVCLAEAVGARPSYRASGALYEPADALLDAIEAKIGDIHPSDIEGGLYKLMVKGRTFDPRDAWSAYIAWRALDIAGENDPVAEIGGGIGKAALFAKQFGVADYTIYDLPIINVVQAWYLIKSGVKVALYGEEPSPDAVKILPYWCFTIDQSFALTINTDSFPEMDRPIVEDYLETIRQNSKRLLSINQEEQRPYGDGRIHLIASQVIEENGGFRRLYRCPFWFLENYVEELYDIV